MKNKYKILGETAVIFIERRSGSVLNAFIDTSDLNKVKRHINNKRSNLRVLTAAENNQNFRMQKNNTSGARGVYWCNHRKKWRAFVKHNEKNHYFGYHTTVRDAEKAVQEGRGKLLPYA